MRLPRPIPTRRAALGLLGAAALAPCLPVRALAAAPSAYRFLIVHEGTAIGRHEVGIAPEPGGFRATSRIEAEVKLGFVTLFSYRQEAVDRWRGGVLVQSRIETDDQGERSTVEVLAEGGRLLVTGAGGTVEAPLGAMTDLCFYNPGIVREPRLIDGKRGGIVPIQADATAKEALTIAGRRVQAERWRIEAEGVRSGLVWYDGEGRWVRGRVKTEEGETVDYIMA
ncbi:MAG: hypothetical protein KDG89_13745 [Geminicoccaceae bacterium]|nr:hypothetical protein [Geminicoccaceae bacterium]